MWKMTLLAGLILSVAGCGTIGPSGNFCDVAKPIYMHSADDLTDATVDEIVNFDITGMKLCGWKPPGK
jgi:hypothetical protein